MKGVSEPQMSGSKGVQSEERLELLRGKNQEAVPAQENEDVEED